MYGQKITSVSVEDLNGDGNPDLIAMSWGVNPRGDGTPSSLSPLPAQVSVLLGNAGGTFPAYATYSLPSPTTIPFLFQSPVSGDYNFDGKLDLATANDVEPELQIQLLGGNGDGTFQQAQTSNLSGEKNGGLSVGDFLGNGHPDLAFTTT